jgi:hypothetical protein
VPQDDRRAAALYQKACEGGDAWGCGNLGADRVYSYDHGKLIAGEENEAEFFHDIETYNLQRQWLMEAGDFAQKFQQAWEGSKSRPPSKQSQRHWLLHALRTHEEGTAPPPVEQQERQTRCPDWKQIIARLVAEGLVGRSPGKLKLTKAGLDWAANDRLDHPDGPPRGPAFRVHMSSIGSLAGSVDLAPRTEESTAGDSGEARPRSSRMYSPHLACVVSISTQQVSPTMSMISRGKPGGGGHHFSASEGWCG